MRKAACFAFLLAMLPLAVAHAKSAVDMVEYNGWEDAYKMSNGRVEVVVVPEIGRIMRYAFVGGENVLWEDESLKGKQGDREGWLNFGGDKVWIWPQFMWEEKWGEWAPPYECDQAPQIAEVSRPSMIRMISPMLDGYHVRIVREIKLSNTGTRVEIETRLECGQKLPDKPWAAWSVTQVREPDFLLARMAPKTRMPAMYKHMNDTKWDAIAREGHGVVRIDAPEAKSAKVGMDADILAWVKGNLLFTERVGWDESILDGVAPGDLAQVFYSREGNPYVELEFTSPKVKLAEGRHANLNVTWELKRLRMKEVTSAAVAKILRRR